jgi:hypothetical protein
MWPHLAAVVLVECQVQRAVVGHGFDIDHVAIGPQHVFAIEVKWSTRRWDVQRPERDAVLQAHLNAARRGARRIRGVLKPTGVGTVTPVLVLRGPGAGALKERHTIDGVVVLPAGDGRARFERLLDLPPERLDQPTVVAQLRAYSDMREHAESVRRPDR